MKVRRRRALVGAFSTLSASLLGCSARSANEAPFWYSFGGRPREVLLSLVDLFHRTQSEHRVAPVYQGDYLETLAKLRTAIHAGMAPPLVHVVGEAIPYLADAHVLERLDQVAELAQGFHLVPELTEAAMFSGARPDGIFSLPFNRSTPVAYINEEVFAREGLRAPETWDDLCDTARRLTRGEKAEKRFGFACAIDWWFWLALVGQAGGDIFDGEGRPTLASDAAVQALELWQSLISEDVMRPPPGRDYDAWQVVNGDFIEGRAAMIWTSTAFIRYFEDNAKFAFKTAPLPAKVRRSVPTGGSFFVMPRGAPERQQRAAAAFLAFMLEPAHANRFATETGYIPISTDGLRDLEARGYFSEHPNHRVAIDQLGAARGFPWARSLLRVEREVVQPRLEEAVLGKKDARAALEAAQRMALEDP